MPLYSLDSNIFIQSKNAFYALDMFPVFWDWLEKEAQNGHIFCITDVYNELQAGKDNLSKWLKARRTVFVREITLEAQIEFAHISQYVVDNYPSHNADFFLDRADPLLIGHAKVTNAIVVTQERRVPDNSQKVKIPNICDAFGVAYVDLYTMMRQLDAKFS